MPKVTVAIPTLLGGRILADCLSALSRQVYREFEVIVVNNGAISIDPLETAWPFPLEIIHASRNLGFGAAINKAIGAARGSLVATLNDDTEVDSGWLDALVSEIEADDSVGMCASRIQLYEGRGLDSAGLLIARDGSSKQRKLAGKAHTEDVGAPEDVLMPSACAALYRRQMLEEIGMFDEEFFLYCEDTDLGLRARWAGWRCRYVPDALVWHRYSRTAGAASELKARLVERNRLWVAIKNFPLSALISVPLYSVGRYLYQWRFARQGIGTASSYIASGGSAGRAFGIAVDAWWQTLRIFPDLLRKRSHIRQSRRIAAEEFLSLMRCHGIAIKDLARA